MIIAASPSIVCIPWYQIKFGGCFNGTVMDPQRPIYWADIPGQIPEPYSFLHFFPDRTYHKRWLVKKIVHGLLAVSNPLMIFASEKESFDIANHLKDLKIQYEDGEQYYFNLYHTKNEKLRFPNRCYFQKSPEDGELHLFSADTPFQFPAHEYLRKS